MGPKVYDFMDEERKSPRIYIADRDESLEFRPCINFPKKQHLNSSKINTTALDSSVEAPSPFSFVHSESPVNNRLNTTATDCGKRITISSSKLTKSSRISPHLR